MVLDADEIITDFDIQYMQSFCIESNKKIVGRLKIVNEYEDEKGNKKYIERVSRVFNKNFLSMKVLFMSK